MTGNDTLSFGVSIVSGNGEPMGDMCFELRFFVYGHPKKLLFSHENLLKVDGKYYAVMDEHEFVNGALFCEAVVKDMSRVVTMRVNTGYVVGGGCECGQASTDASGGYTLTVERVERPATDWAELVAEELHAEKMRLPELTADRAIADEAGNRIADTYVTRNGLTKHIQATYNEQFLENPPLVTDGYITPAMLSEGVKGMLAEAGATINNLPDGEDLKTENGVLKLADKDYNAGAYSGLGRVYLRKNIVAGVNVLTQSMMSKKNTIYVIQYDYDLQGAEITVPEGCVLDFQGGSLSNGNVIGNNTSVKAEVEKIFNIDVLLLGFWNISEAYPEWFGAVGDGVTDNDYPFIRIKLIMQNTNINYWHFTQKYYNSSTTKFENIKDKYLNFDKSYFLGNTDKITGIGGVLAISGENLTITGGIIKPRFWWGTHDGSGGDNGLSVNGKNILIDNVIVDMTEGGFRGIDLQGGEGSFIEDIIISNCYTIGGDNGIDILPHPGTKANRVTITNCHIKDAWQGILVNPGWGLPDDDGIRHGVYSENIIIDNIIIDNPSERGLDLRYVDGLYVSNVRVLNTYNIGVSIVASRGEYSNIFINANNTVNQDGVGIRNLEDFGKSGYEELPLFSSFSNIVINGGFKYSINNQRNNVLFESIKLSGFTSYGIWNNLKKAIYKDVLYDSDLEVSIYDTEARFINILKVNNDLYFKRSIDDIPYNIGLGFPTFQGQTYEHDRNYRIVHAGTNLKVQVSKDLNGTPTDDIIIIKPDKSVELLGSANISPLGGVIIPPNQDDTTGDLITYKISNTNSALIIRNLKTNKIIASINKDGSITSYGSLTSSGRLFLPDNAVIDRGYIQLVGTDNNLYKITVSSEGLVATKV